MLPGHRRQFRPRFVFALLALAALAAVAGSCAYYNTFYLARRYYFRATDGQPYDVGRANSAQAQNYSKAIDYSKKLLATYPKSKWIDDAYLMWAKGLIGRDDPLQSVTMLQDFNVDFPKSELKPEAEFYLGLAYRNARKYPQAISAFDEFLVLAPKHELVPYTHYERSLALTSLQRYGEAADAAGQVLEKYPHHLLHDRALRQRAEARLQQGDFDGARADFHSIGELAANDEDRFQFLMRELDCLEAGRRYDNELAVLRSELTHTPPPPRVEAGQLPPAGSDHYGRLVLRVGTTHLLAGRIQAALGEYEKVMTDYPKSALSAEAQYRIGFTYETGGDDFDRALQEYAKVKEQFGQSVFTQQAQQRADNLQRIMQYRHGGGADSLEKLTEAAFLTAEIHLFQLNNPERALEEYAKISDAYPGTASAGRALTARAWVLSRKLDRGREADSLFWEVVHKYPATEAQLAARDYLEMEGHLVPDSLIVAPAPKVVAAVVDTAKALVAPPLTVPPIGTGAFAPPDSLRLRGPRPDDPRLRLGYPPGMPVDSLGRPIGPAPFSPADSFPRADTTGRRGGG